MSKEDRHLEMLKTSYLAGLERLERLKEQIQHELTVIEEIMVLRSDNEDLRDRIATLRAGNDQLREDITRMEADDI